jgi:hypothetical protein
MRQPDLSFGLPNKSERVGSRSGFVGSAGLKVSTSVSSADSVSSFSSFCSKCYVRLFLSSEASVVRWSSARVVCFPLEILLS